LYIIKENKKLGYSPCVLYTFLYRVLLGSLWSVKFNGVM